MKENGELPERLLFPSERKNSTARSKIPIAIDKETSERLDDLVEASNGLSKSEIVEKLVCAEWESQS